MIDAAGSSGGDQQQRRERLRQMITVARQAAAGARSSDVGGLAGGSGIGLPPGLIEGYQLQAEVHRGGQGVVYRGIQESTRRPVAIKVLKEGPFAGEMDRLRFEREAGVLAQLNHRSIVGILDRGTAAGTHFLVMDFVDGRPLDRFVREEALDVPARLQLFVAICDAVSAAHLRGVIHRDLKPTNILVDSAGEPRVLDFGLAKVAGTPSGSSAHATETGQFVGSLPWASPEQAGGMNSEMDLRSDVYSLGVILYQLLTNRLPILTVGSLEDVLVAIRTATPARPSTHAPEIDDDLDTIVLKCLMKEPARRYQSVGELARDVRHYLAGEPIEAKRDSALYMLRCTIRRHRLGVGVAVVFVALMSAATIALSILYRAKATEQARAEREKALAVQARDKAERAAVKADAVTDFLRTMLASPDPGRDGHEVRVVDVMKTASAEIPQRFAKQPDVQLAVRSALGEAYYGLGLYAQAEEEIAEALRIARREFGDDHEETLTSLTNLAGMLWVQGKLSEAEPIAREAVRQRLRRFGESHVESINAMTTLAAIRNARGHPEEGVEWNQRAYAAAQKALGPEHTRTVECRNNLAFSLDKAGRLSEAEALYRSVLEVRRREGATEHPNTVITMQALANCLVQSGKLDEAESLARQVVQIRRRILPDGHVNHGDAAHVLGRVLMAKGDARAAVDQFRAALAIHEKTLPPASWRTAVTRCDLGYALLKSGSLSEAEQSLLASFESLARTGDDHPRQMYDAVVRLAQLYEAWDAAEPGTGKAEKAAEWRAKLPTTQPSATRSR